MSNPLLEKGVEDAGYQLPKFSEIEPEHVEPAVMRVLEDNREQIESLLAQSANHQINFETGILPLEELGDRLHHVWAPISHLHAVTNSPGLREAYNKCLPALSRYHTELSQDERLFKLYEKVAADAE